MMKKNNLTQAEALPNYEGVCEVCEQSPTVTIMQQEQTLYDSSLCGVCFFGTAQALDPDEWNHLD